MAGVEAKGKSSTRASSGLRMFWLLIFRSLTVRGRHAAVAFGAIAVGAAVVSALTCLYFDISIKMSEELRAFGANVMMTPRGNHDAPGTHILKVATLRAAMAALPRDKVVGGSPFLYGVAHLDAGDAVLAGVDFSALKAIFPYWQVDGDWVSTDFDLRNIMVGRNVAHAMQLKIGSPVTMTNREHSHQVAVQVKGIVDTGGAEDDQVFANLALAQALFDRPGDADLAMLSVNVRGHEADILAAQVARRFSQIEVSPIRKISQADGQILGKIEGLMALVVVIILSITILCVNATLTAMVGARTREIGLQKAIGASNAAIAAQFMVETAVICLAGTTLGIILGFALAQFLGQAIFDAWVTFRLMVVPLTLGLSLVAALAAAILPVRGAVRIVPARVLRGE